MGKNSKKTAGKSKWFTRLLLLATGLVLSVGSIIGAVMLVSDSKNSERVQGSAMQARHMAVGDYIQNFGGRKWRVIGFDTNGSITGMAGAPLLRTDSLEARRRFSSSGNNSWANSELRAFLNNRTDFWEGSFANNGFLSNFTQLEQSIIISNVRLETARTDNLSRYQNALSAGRIEAILNGNGFAPSVSFTNNSGIAGGNGNAHSTAHRYVHRDTVFILCLQQLLALNNLGLRYANAAQSVPGGFGWQAGAQAHVGNHFAWSRTRDSNTGNATNQTILTWTRSPWAGCDRDGTFLSPGFGRFARANEINSERDFTLGTDISFAPALYINPNQVFRVARDSETGRNEQAGFRVFEFSPEVAQPTNVRIEGQSIMWSHTQGSGAPVSSFDIMRGEQVVARVGASARQFDLTRLPDNFATGTQVGSYRALAVGLHSLSVAALGVDGARAGVSSAVVYDRVGRVDSVVVSGTTSNLVITWPRPISVGDMPGVQLSASVSGVYGTDSSVTWSSSNPSIASVDALSGFVRATWSDNMWEHRIANNNRFTLIRATSVFDNSVVGEFRVYIIFNDPPGAVTIGVDVSGGLREIELPPDASALENVTRFMGSAFGYNLTLSQREVTWASSNTSVATINRYTGMLSAHSVGVARITASSVVGNVPYAFYVTVTRDGTAVATGVTIFCESDRTDERRIVIPYDAVDMPFLDLRAIIEGHNIASQLVTWTSSCGASVGVPSQFLSLSLTADGVRVTGLLQGGVFIITATPVGAVGAVGNFRIFVDRAVAPSVTNISVSVPTVSTLVIPMQRPILLSALPSTQLTATTIGGVGGGTGSAVVWTSSCGARAGLGVESVAGEFVEFIVSHLDPNVVSVRAVDRGLVGFSQAVTITATSSLTPSQFASRVISVEQPVITSISIAKVMESHPGTLIIPYGNTDPASRAGLDLRAFVGATNASVLDSITWVSYPAGAIFFDNVRLERQNVLVTARPGFAGVVSIRAKGAYCGTTSNEIVVEITQESVTSVRILGPTQNMFEHRVSIAMPRPDTLQLPVIQLGASVGGSFAAASNLVWTSNCGGEIVEFLGDAIGGWVMLRALDAGLVLITATHSASGFYGTFTIIVEQSALYSVEILADGVVREQTAMLIPLVYADGVYALSDLTNRQSLELSVTLQTQGSVITDFVWTSSNESVVRISGTSYNSISIDSGSFVTVLPYGVGTATIRAVSVLDPSIYATFTIFVTRGTASCNIQDGILDLPTIAEGDVRVILVCEHYFGAARMSHIDMSLEYAQNFALESLQINISGAQFLGWGLSRGGEPFEMCESATTRLPTHLLDLEAGIDTILLFAVWYIPYVANESGSNLVRNLIIGSLCVAGAGAAGTAGYIAQSRIRARRSSSMSEWGI